MSQVPVRHDALGRLVAKDLPGAEPDANDGFDKADGRGTVTATGAL